MDRILSELQPMELMMKNLRDTLNVVCSQSNSVVHRWNELDIQFDSIQKSIKEHADKVNSNSSNFEFVQKSVKESEKVVEVKKVDVQITKNLVEELSEEHGLTKNLSEFVTARVDVLEEEANLLRNFVGEKLKQIKLEEERIRKYHEDRMKEIVLFEKSAEQHGRVVGWREKRLERKKKDFEDKCKEVKSTEETLDSVRLLLDQRFEELESKEKDLSSMERMNEELDGKLQRKCRRYALKRKRLMERGVEVERVEGRVRSLQRSSEERYEELKTREKELLAFRNELEKREKVLELREKQLEAKERAVEEKMKAFEFKEKQMSKFPHFRVKLEEPQILPINYSASADLQFWVTMDGRSLQVFLNKRVDQHESMRDEVSVALRMSSDPAKLALDAMQGFYPPHLREGDVEFEGSIVQRSCVLLLEQLMRISPIIMPDVREEARKVAAEWKTKLTGEAEKSLQVLGFLLLLATYGLAPAFDPDELIHFFDMVALQQQNSGLAEALGLPETSSSVVLCPKMKSELSEVLPGNNEIPLSPDVLSHAITKGTSLPSFSNEHANDFDSILNEVSAALQTSKDSAKLFRDAMQQIFYTHLEGYKGLEASSTRTLVYLLKQLMNASLQIKPGVKEEAIDRHC